MRVKDLLWTLVIALMVIFVGSVFVFGGKPAEAQDSGLRYYKLGMERSAVDIYVDPEQGCQYLVPNRGGITPRKSRIGEHLGCK